MNILIIGGAGMIGRKLAERLARDGELGSQAISSLTLYDVVAPAVPAGAKVPVRAMTTTCRRRTRRAGSSLTGPMSSSTWRPSCRARRSRTSPKG